MADEFGTVNLRKGERGKELEAVRQQYRNHRDALVRMIADAPTEHLAAEYQKLIRDIDNSIAKLDEIEGRPATSAGTRPLVTTPVDEQETLVSDPLPPSDGEPAQQGSRVLMIVIAGVIVLAAILWLLWRASGDRNKAADQTATTTTTTTMVETVAPPAVATTPVPIPETATGAIRITPAAASYGTIRKGTRAVRQFTIENTGAAAVSMKVARSNCRCLFYDYTEKVPAHGKEQITVTIDGARAKVGELHETVHVSSKSDPAVAAQFDVNATIQ